jgi:hypothetical protein
MAKLSGGDASACSAVCAAPGENSFKIVGDIM